jgi:uncharacterized protein
MAGPRKIGVTRKMPVASKMAVTGKMLELCKALQPARLLLIALAIGLLLATATPVWALSAQNYPSAPPSERLLDATGVFSRAAAAEVEQALEALSKDELDAHMITVERLDYGLSLGQLGKQLLDRWAESGGNARQLLFLYDLQTKSAEVVASAALADTLEAPLLRSIGRTTMGQPLRQGARYRQASLDGIGRLQTVLEGGDDPGEPATAELVQLPTTVPTHEQTQSSNARTWVLVLLAVGTIVPMLTWWIFSR